MNWLGSVTGITHCDLKQIFENKLLIFCHFIWEAYDGYQRIAGLQREVYTQKILNLDPMLDRC